MNIAERQSPILSTCADGVLRLSMNRPLARNALSGALIEALSGAFAMAAADENLHVVILAAEGRTFCAGHDLK
ncbi:MAG: enoyl-CoA hydratase-related protein, partial [Rhizomicrobium sp.]